MADFGKLAFAVSFAPQTAFPLDARYYFDSYATAAVAAQSAVEVGSSDGTYFVGENIAVVEGSEAKMYIIQPDKSLKEVGAAIKIDPKQFSQNENGVISLLGFADAVAGAQLTKDADGNVKWIKPDTTTVEGLSTAVKSLEEVIGDSTGGLVKDVADNATAISNLDNYIKGDGGVDSKIAANTTAIEANKTATETNAAAIEATKTEIANVKKDLADNYDTSAEVDNKISTKIASVYKPAGSVEFASLPALEAAIEGNVYNILDAFTTTDDFVEGVGAEYPAGSNIVCIKVEESYKWDVLAGFVDLSSYATKNDVSGTYATKDELAAGLDEKVSKVTGKQLSTEDYTTDEKNKLEGIQEGAQVNTVDGVSDEFEISADGKVLSVKEIDSSKITGLASELESKVDKVEGSSLVEDTDIAKLKGLANIKSANAGEFSISDAGELSVKEISVDKVAGLTTELGKKIEGIKLNGVVTTPKEGIVDIPVATEEVAGLVKSSAADELNGIQVSAEGKMSVAKLSMANLEPDTETVFVLDGGNSTSPTV